MSILSSPCLPLAALALALAFPPARAQTRAEIELRTAEAKMRIAIAEAERAELLARLPAADSRPLAGTLQAEPFGAAGLVKAFDLALALAGDLCAVLPAEPKTTLFDPLAMQGVVAARVVVDAIDRLSADLVLQNAELQKLIDQHRTPPQLALAPLALAAVPATVRAVADLAALFRTNASASSTSFGEGTRALFATALAARCPERLAGMGSGYLGEFDPRQAERLMEKVRALVRLRADYAGRGAVVAQMAGAAAGEQKKALAAVAAATTGVLRSVDSFVESLRIGEAGQASPLFNAGRYLGYGERSRGALVLDFDLRLEGMSIMRQNMFTGQHLRLSGVAFLWYRLHEPNGALRLANTVRRMTPPVEVDLRGAPGGDFWQASAAPPAPDTRQRVRAHKD